MIEEQTVKTSPASILPITVYIPYVPKAPLPKAMREKMIRERNLGTFRRDPDMDNDDEV